MSLDQQLALLATYQRNLEHLLQQAALFGGEVFAPPETANGIAIARAEIARIKAVLRKNDIPVDDHPGDNAPPHIEAQPRAGDVVVARDKILGDNRVINTQGGDYAEGNIDKRQSIFIGQQIIQQPYTSALHQLRAPVSDFVGRDREIEQLVMSLTKGGGVGISGVRGMGGIGKTELAYLVADRLKDIFPDAQLVIELRGSTSEPTTPQAALQKAIRSFDWHAKLPEDVGDLQAIYRSHLDGKRVLILADDVKDRGQVICLTPPSGCGLLITSRQRFTLPGMYNLDLQILPAAAAERLVVGICPRIRSAASRIVELCGALPLALRISASILANDDTLPVDRYVARLADARARLAQLRDPDDPTLDVEASLELSYRAVGATAASVLCPLSVFPSSFDLSAAEAVVQIVSGSVEDHLGFLRRYCLLDWDPVSQRYSLHDLVRVFASNQLDNADDVHLRHAQHYLDVAWRADELYKQGGEATFAALALFDQERTNIDVGWAWARTHAPSPSIDTLLRDYAGATVSVGDLRYNLRNEQIPQFLAALGAVRRQGDIEAAAAVLGNIGQIYVTMGEISRAEEIFKQVLAIARDIGNREQESTALEHLGLACYAKGELGQAIIWYKQQLEIVRELSNSKGEIAALGLIGLAYCSIGQIQEGLVYEEQALVLAQKLGDRRREGGLLSNIGQAHRDLGELGEAERYFKQAITIAREIGDRLQEATALGGLGSTYRLLQDYPTAIALHEQRLAITQAEVQRQGEAEAIGSLAQVYYELNDTLKAVSMFQQQLAIAQELGAQHMVANVSKNLGRIFAEHGNLAPALPLLQAALNYEREQGLPDDVQIVAYLEQVQRRLQLQAGEQG